MKTSERVFTPDFTRDNVGNSRQKFSIISVQVLSSVGFTTEDGPRFW
jgi:hypothetical protein